MKLGNAKGKLFFHGASQAVLLPDEFSFQGDEVDVRRQGDDVVLSSRPRPRMQSLIEALSQFEPGFQMERMQSEV